MSFGFAHFSRLAPQHAAVVEAAGRTWTAQHLSALVNRLSRAFRSCGLSPGDAVAILSPNCAEFLAALLAATQSGLAFVPINWRLSQKDVSHVIQASRARLVLIHERAGTSTPGLLKLADTFAPEVFKLAIGRLPAFMSLDEYVAGQSSSELEDPVPGRVMSFTSATTGTPKGIVRRVADPVAALERSIGTFTLMGTGPADGNVHLCASALYHSAPLEFARIALHMGHTVVLMDQWEPEAFLQCLEQQRVTSTFMTPTMFVRLLKLAESTRRRYGPATLKWVNHAGAPCAPEVKRKMIEWFGPIIWEGYGASEGNGTVVSSADWLRYPGTVGRPLPGSQLKILDEDGNEQRCGERGFVYLTHFNGGRFEYLHDPGKTAAAYRGDFFTVGDVGYLNEEGYLFLCDRQDDLIITFGIHVYPAEIERELILHPEVVDCAVFGAQDPVLGQAIVAVVQPVPAVQDTRALASELLRLLLERLGPKRLPRRVEFVSELPRDPNGKLYKRQLRERYDPVPARSRAS